MAEVATTLKVPVPPPELARIPLVQNNRSFGWISDQVSAISAARCPGSRSFQIATY